jgi:hypothetical protein
MTEPLELVDLLLRLDELESAARSIGQPLMAKAIRAAADVGAKEADMLPPKPWRPSLKFVRRDDPETRPGTRTGHGAWAKRAVRTAYPRAVCYRTLDGYHVYDLGDGSAEYVLGMHPVMGWIEVARRLGLKPSAAAGMAEARAKGLA